MAKIMVFIDGTWLYRSSYSLSKSYGDSNFKISFGKLPIVLSEEVAKSILTTGVDVVRTYLFGSIPAHYDLEDDYKVIRMQEFFDLLKEEHHYEVELFPINFMGKRIRRADRDPKDFFEPKEKCVDVALATNMLYLAAIPYAYDIAIAVIGDRDFIPMLQHVRKLGKRVAIASVKSSCAYEFSDPCDEARVKDFDIIWIDDLLHKLELKYERHQRNCESPIHVGERLVWTTYHPRKGKKFFCDACRQELSRQKAAFQSNVVETGMACSQSEPINGSAASNPSKLNGKIKRIIPEKNCGFIAASNGKDYYFSLSEFATDSGSQQVTEGIEVEFEVKNNPFNGKAGAALKVHAFSTQTPPEDAELSEFNYTS